MQFGCWCRCCFGALFELLVTVQAHFCESDGRVLGSMQVTARAHFGKIDGCPGACSLGYWCRCCFGMLFGVWLRCWWRCRRMFARLMPGCSGVLCGNALRQVLLEVLVCKKWPKFAIWGPCWCNVVSGCSLLQCYCMLLFTVVSSCLLLAEAMILKSLACCCSMCCVVSVAPLYCMQFFTLFCSFRLLVAAMRLQLASVLQWHCMTLCTLCCCFRLLAAAMQVQHAAFHCVVDFPHVFRTLVLTQHSMQWR